MAMPATVFAVVVTSIGCKATRVRCGGERQKSRDHECRSAHGPSPSDRAIFARRRDGIEGLSPRRGAFEQIDADRSASFEKGGVRFTNLPDDLPAAVFGYDRALLVDQRRHDETFAVGANLRNGGLFPNCHRDRQSTRLNSSHSCASRMPSYA